jgi:microcystin-dependent protein
MKSSATSNGAIIAATQYNALRDDARGGASFLAHQQLGVLALPTNPSNGQTWTLTINGTAVSGAFVTSIGSTAGNVLIGATAAATATNLVNLLYNPELTSSTQVALSLANQQLLTYVGFSLVTTNLTIYSFNTLAAAQLTSFTASTTATGGSWTANTLKLYVEPGTFYVGITQVVFLGASTPAFAAPASNPRIDILTIDSSGTLAITQGSENVSPVAPTYPTGKLVICEVYNVVGETAIYDNANQSASQGYISKDARGFQSVFYIGDNSQIGAGVIQASNLANAGTCATGSVVMFAASSPPAGWIVCDGSSLLRAGTYATLFAAIGTTFGNADGSHFNIPDMRGRVPIGVGTGTGGGASGNGLPTGGSALTARALADWLGEETHVLSIGEMPAHTHPSVLVAGAGGAVSAGSSTASSSNTGSTGSGTAHNIIQPTMALNFIIKI